MKNGVPGCSGTKDIGGGRIGGGIGIASGTAIGMGGSRGTGGGIGINMGTGGGIA